MIRVRSSCYPDGRPYLQVHLPPLTHEQLYILESVVDIIWEVLGHKAATPEGSNRTLSDTEFEQISVNFRGP
jgi:hypothetical protein